MQSNPHKLTVIDGKTLMDKRLPPTKFCVDTLLPQGLCILGGSPKVGKSWLVLDLCVHVAQGTPLWGLDTTKGQVLYCIAKVQLIAFLATDRAFGMRRKSEWHKSVIQNFIYTQGDLYPMKDCQKKLYHEIGERIRKSRQEARISQEELAEYAGISGSYISDVEAGKRNFSVDVLMKIAEALQVSTDWILRADTPGTAAVLNRDIEHILDGLLADELNDVMLILTDIKRSIKRAKCIAKHYGDN